ncbi:MAG: LytTR family DNA-binding domain-containing protein [Clostridia bacterium]|nr:LytTR family DNA-binding domain-containing protein [Clostridia bacterium]
MLRIGICDDVRDARTLLRALLERVLEGRALPYSTFEFSSGEGVLRWLQSHPGELDLVFLDIEMSGMNGMETARCLRQSDAGLQLVFVTGYAEYVYDGYSVGALGYLLKPCKREQLEGILDRALGTLHRDAEQAFVCRSGETVYRIPRKDILYFYSDRRLVHCVTAEKTFTFYGKLDEVEATLGDNAFVRIHQRYLVHAAAVEQVDGSEARVNGQALPVSRACRNDALLALTRAMLK